MKVVLSLVCFLSLGMFIRADEYYCMFFATDAIHPRYCHVWGTFAQMKGEKLVREVTISWAPENDWTLRDRRQRGANISLEDSMKMSGRHSTCLWGPFGIHEGLYRRAVFQYENPGVYKMMDIFSRPGAINCIHRLTDISGSNAVTHIRYGKFAGVAVYRHYSRLGLLQEIDNGAMVIDSLGLSRYRLRRR